MKKTILPIRLLKLHDQGCHPIIKVLINGKPAQMLVDTGASKTVFDTHMVQKFIPKAHLEKQDQPSTGLGTSSMKSLSACISRIEIGGFVLNDYTAVILDLSHVNRFYKKLKLKPIEGVLGGDILKFFIAMVDYGGKTLTLRHPSTKPKRPKSKKK